MSFIRRHWYSMGGIVAIVASVYLVFSWNDLAVIQRLYFIGFISMLIHQFEEYGCPGGIVLAVNSLSMKSEAPDRYPLNQNGAMVANLIYTYVFVLLPFFFPKLIWLGLAPMLSWFFQFIIHGIFSNIQLKTFYNPGFGATLFIQIPLAMYYIYYIQSSGLASGWDWVFGIVYLLLYLTIFLNKLTYSVLADKNSPYPFEEEEINRFNMPQKIEKLTRKRS